MDVLTDILKSIRLTGSFWCRTEAGAPWGLDFERMDMAHFHAVRRGSCWFQMEGLEEPLFLSNGDLVFLPHGHAHMLSDDLQTQATPICDLIGSHHTPLDPLKIGSDGNLATLLCGCCEFEKGGIHPFLSVLPSLIYIRGDDQQNIPWLEGTLDFITRESFSKRPLN